VAIPSRVELTDLSLQGASTLVDSKQVSPVELTRACLERIDALNPSLNALITITAEAALDEARLTTITLAICSAQPRSSPGADRWDAPTSMRCKIRATMAAVLCALSAAGLLAVRPALAAIDATAWHRASVHGHKMFYAMQGTGPTLVLLHGGGDSGEHSFARQLDSFARHFRIVAPDQVGQGRTPDVPGALTYTGMMDDTAALMKELKLEHVDMVGFSDGGILALMLAYRHPELVRRLVVSGVNIAPEGLNAADLEELRAIENPSPKTIDEKLAHLWASSPTDAELNVAMLGKITQPVLVISGDRDAITLEHTLTIFHALPTAELCVLPGTDHATFSGRSEWLNPIIDAFLDRPVNLP
jgi:pimeloyl-ACP methyl ester carboxylesterase